MTDPNWKPQPGKPAMTRDGKMLVVDLVKFGAGGFWSARLKRAWRANGKSYADERDFDLIEPTAAILAAHGIDADGKPVAEGPEAAQGQLGDDALSAYSSSAPFQPIRVDDRWFRLFERAIEGGMAGGAQTTGQCVDVAISVADLAMAEVAKREGR